MATQPKSKPSFTSVMDMPMSQIPVPKPMPSGEYLAMVVGTAVPGKASTGTPFVTITFQYLEALRSVNKDDLQAALEKPDGTVTALREKTINTRLYLTDQAARRNADFLMSLGIDENMSIPEGLQNVAGRQAYITVNHRPSTSGDGLFAEVTGIAKVD